MKDTIAEQIMSAHLVEGKLEEGTEIALAIDQTLTQDATGTMVYLEFESLEIPAVKSKIAVSYVDHNIIQTDSRNVARCLGPSTPDPSGRRNSQPGKTKHSAEAYTRIP